MADGTANDDCAVIRAGRLLAFFDTIGGARWPSTIVLDSVGVTVRTRSSTRTVAWAQIEYLFAPHDRYDRGCIEIVSRQGSILTSAIAWSTNGAVRKMQPHVDRFAAGRQVLVDPPNYSSWFPPPRRPGDPTAHSSLRAIHVAPLGWHRVRIIASGDGFLARLEAADGTPQVDKPLRHTRAEAIADGDQLIEEFG